MLVDDLVVDHHDQRAELPAGGDGVALEVEEVEHEVADPLAVDVAGLHEVADAGVLGFHAVDDSLGDGAEFLERRGQHGAHHLRVVEDLHVGGLGGVEAELAHAVHGAAVGDDLVEAVLGVVEVLPFVADGLLRGGQEAGAGAEQGGAEGEEEGGDEGAPGVKKAPLLFLCCPAACAAGPWLDEAGHGRARQARWSSTSA